MESFAEYLETTTQRTFAEKLRARGVEVTQGAISQWLKNGVPPKRVPLVSELTGVPMHKLRPDMFPVPGEDAAVDRTATHAA